MTENCGVRLSALVAVLAGLCGALMVMAAPASAAETVVLTPGVGSPGDMVTMVGTFLDACRAPGRPASGMRALWKGPEPVDQLGLPFSTTLTVPVAAAGSYEVVVACFDKDVDVPKIAEASTTFTVVPPAPPARVVLSPAAARPGERVEARGSNYTEKCFPAGTALRIDGIAARLVRGPGRGEPGEVVVTFSVPELSPGPVTVELACADGVSATSQFTVTPRVTTVTTTPPTPSTSAATGSSASTTSTPPRIPSETGEATGGRRTRLDRTEFVSSVPLPGEVSWAPQAVLVSAGLFTVLFWVLGFPSEPFNKTVEENRERIRAWFGMRAGLRRLAPEGWPGFFVYSLVAAALLTLVEPDTGFDPASWRRASTLALGFLVAVPVTTLAYCLPAEVDARAIARDVAHLRFLPGALLFAAVCVAFSRWADLQPGYVYGLFAFYAATASPLRTLHAGRGILLGSCCLLAVSLSAWLIWPAVAHTAMGPDPTYGVLVLDAALAATFVLGAQTLVFGLVPLTFLDGHTLKLWDMRAWAVVWGTSLAVLVHVVSAKFVRQVPDLATAVRAASAFLAFFVLSAALWLTLRLSGAATAGPAVDHARPSAHHRKPEQTSRLMLVTGTAALVLIIAVPATWILAGRHWDEPHPPPVRPSTLVGAEHYPAAVVTRLNVREKPTATSARIDTLDAGVTVILRCTSTSYGAGWYELIDPYPGKHVSGVGLEFPDARRPPAC